MTPDTAWTTASIAELGEALRTALLLDCAPVGVRLVRTADEFDACSFRRPGASLHYCAAVKIASEGGSLKLAHEDMACMTAPRTLVLSVITKSMTSR